MIKSEVRYLRMALMNEAFAGPFRDGSVWPVTRKETGRSLPMFLQSRIPIIVAACAVGCGIAAMVVAHDRGVNAVTPQPIAYAAAPLNSAPANAAPSYDDGYYPAFSRPVYVRPPEPEYVPPPVAPAPVYAAPRVVYETGRGHGERHHHHGRSKANSAEIVAGSAGVGAAIGAIAGGGKGAAIGALAGGAGGFAYDRLTH
jgi:hypothetical protein